MKSLLLAFALLAIVYASIDGPTYITGILEYNYYYDPYLTVYVNGEQASLDDDTFETFYGVEPGDVIGFEVESGYGFAAWIYTQWGQSIYTRPNSGWYCKWGDASTASWLAHWDTFPVNGIDGTWESEYADVTVTTMETTPYIDFRMRASDDDLEFYNYEVPFHSRWMGPSDADGSDETYICRIQIPEPSYSDQYVRDCVYSKVNQADVEGTYIDADTWSEMSPPISFSLWGHDVERVSWSQDGYIRFDYDAAQDAPLPAGSGQRMFIPNGDTTSTCNDYNSDSDYSCERLCTLGVWASNLESLNSANSAWWQGVTENGTWVITGESLAYVDECQNTNDDLVDVQVKIYESDIEKTVIQVHYHNLGKTNLWSHNKQDPAIGIVSCDGTSGVQYQIGSDQTPENYDTQYGAYEDYCVEYLFCLNGVYVIDEEYAYEGCECAPRFYWDDTTGCTPCPANTWKDTIGNDDSCSACPLFSEFETAITGMDDNSRCLCIAGFGGDASANTDGRHEGYCEVCAGTDASKNSLSNDLCVCTDPLHAATDAGICECDAGYYGNAYRPEGCVECFEDTYKRWSGNDGDCLPCGTLGSAVNGSTYCSCDANAGWHFDSDTSDTGACYCSMGYYLDTTDCVACPEDTYKISYGNDVDDCVACPTYSDTNGYTGEDSATDCVCECGVGYCAPDATYAQCECSAGYWASVSGTPATLSCFECADGYVKAVQSNTVNCTQCTGNKISNYYHTACICDADYGYDEASDSCIACVVGSNYTTSSKSEGNDVCDCDDVYATLVDGSVSVCECIAGYYPLSDACTACPSNTYKQNSGNVACTDCPENSSYDYTGAIVCTCAEGYYMNADNTACVACPVDTYKNVEGNEVSLCVACPYGSTTSSATANTDVTDCECNAGRDGSDIEYYGCPLCEEDTYKSTVSNVACDSCPGYTQSAEGATSLDMCLCEIDYYPGTTTAVACQPCPDGYFRHYLARESCWETCPSGSSLQSGGSADLLEMRVERDDTIAWEDMTGATEVDPEVLYVSDIMTDYVPGLQFSLGDALHSLFIWDDAEGIESYSEYHTTSNYEREFIINPVNTYDNNYVDWWTQIPPEYARYLVTGTSPNRKMVFQFKGWLQAIGSTPSEWQVTFYEATNTHASAHPGYFDLVYKSFQPICNSDAQAYIYHYMYDYDTSDYTICPMPVDNNNYCFNDYYFYGVTPSEYPESFPAAGFHVWMADLVDIPCTCDDSDKTLVYSDESYQCMCSPGYYYDGSDCLACPIGTYSSSYNLDSNCSSCPANATTYYTGSTEYNDCYCEVGWGAYWGDGDLRCDPCGNRSEASDYITQYPCPCQSIYDDPTYEDGNTCACEPGMYWSGTECENCPSDTYKTEVGDLSVTDGCVACPVNSTTDGYEGQDTIYDCECVAGTGGSPVYGCSPCVGGYKDYIGNYNCDCNDDFADVYYDEQVCECWPGYGGNATDETCTICAAGSYKLYNGNSDCTPCSAGYYQPNTGATYCLQCPAYSTSVSGASSSDDCICSAGYETYGAYCSPCDFDEYKPLAENDYCTSCPDNSGHHFIAETAQASCACDPGYGGSSTSSCTACGTGKYKSYRGNYDCDSCDTNEVASTTAPDTFITFVDDITYVWTSDITSPMLIDSYTLPFEKFFGDLSINTCRFTHGDSSVTINCDNNDWSTDLDEGVEIAVTYAYPVDMQTSTVYAGVSGTSPSRVFVIEMAFQFAGVATGACTMQLKIYEDHTNQRIEMHVQESQAINTITEIIAMRYSDSDLSSATLSWYYDADWYMDLGTGWHLWRDMPTAEWALGADFNGYTSPCRCPTEDDYYVNSAGVCTACPDGGCSCTDAHATFLSTGACQCASGYATSGSGTSVTCTACDADTVSDGTATSCSACSSDKIAVANAYCTCNSSYVTDSTGACNTCTGGAANGDSCDCYEWFAFDANPVDYVATDYVCKCMPGWYGNANLANKTNTNSAGWCSPCPSTTYKSTFENGASSICQSCISHALIDPSRNLPATGVDYCICDVDYGGNAGISAGYCVACNGGEKDAAGNYPCSCDDAHASAYDGGNCECHPGYTGDATASTGCSPCDVGTYKGEAGNSACTACPAGSSSSVLGAFSIDSCECSADYGGIAASTTTPCTACVLGTKESGDGNCECIAHAYFVNMWTCECSAGYGLSGSTCSMCDINYYSNDGDCVACPTNAVTPANNQTSRNSCECDIGYEGDATTGSCTACEPGYKKDEVGNTDCVEDPSYVWPSETSTHISDNGALSQHVSAFVLALLVLLALF